MATKRTKRSKEELEQKKGEPLPKREVMSIITTNPGVITIPEDPTLGPEPTDDSLPHPGRGHDVE